MWSDVELGMNFVSENAKCAAMGFNYGIVVCDDGNVEFHSSNKELDRQLTAYFDKLDEKVVTVTCSFNQIAILLQNGIVQIINI